MKTISFIISGCLSILQFSCTVEHEPSLPIINYDSETSQLLIVQTDTAARDTATINIGEFYNKRFPIKDTITLNINKIVKDFDQVEFAYNLATHNNTQEFDVHTSRTNDSLFTYKHNTIDIKPINVASVISGNCIGLYDVNYKGIFVIK